MNKEIIFFLLNIGFVFFISYSLYFDKTQPKNITMNNKFIALSLIFIFLAIQFYTKIKDFGFKYGLYGFIFTLLFQNIATPIPDTSLIVSTPLKIFFDIPMDKTQFVVSCISVFTIIYMYLARPEMLYVTSSGKKCLEIFDSNAYPVLIYSFVGCICFSGILDATIDFLKTSHFLETKTFIYIITLFISLCLYVHEIHAKNLSLTLL
jgi:hypothetical protein